MDGIIKVTPQQLNATASTLQGHATKLAQLAQELSDKASQLSQWQGDASNAYVRKLNDEKQDVMDCVQMVKSRAQELIEMAAKYAAAENANANDANALATDVVQA